MAETSDQIVEEIQVQRVRLSKHVNELESYVRDKADLRTYYLRSPWKFIGGAAAGGMLLALMTLSGPRRDSIRACR
jgi:hypothetical protein